MKEVISGDWTITKLPLVGLFIIEGSSNDIPITLAILFIIMAIVAVIMAVLVFYCSLVTKSRFCGRCS